MLDFFSSMDFMSVLNIKNILWNVKFPIKTSSAWKSIHFYHPLTGMFSGEKKPSQKSWEITQS